jgi:lipopolysaccharide heptosyltransferase I
VCIIKPSALGDVVHALPVLDALRKRWPDASISWVVNRGLRGLLEGHPDLHEVIPFDRPRLFQRDKGLVRQAGFLRELRSRRFDLVVDLQGLFRSGLMAWATGASVRVGRADAREGATAFYTHKIEAKTTHAVDRLLEIAAALGCEPSTPLFQPVIDEESRSWAREKLAGLSRPLLGVNVGARWLTKRWPPNSFAEVAARAARELGSGVVAVGSPEDRPLVDELMAGLASHGVSALDLCGKTTLPGLAAIAEACDLFLSNDTGPLHLAAAAGTPTVSIFLCTDPRKTGAYAPNARVAVTGVACAASCVRDCPTKMECMAELSPEKVWPIVLSALTGQRAGTPHADRSRALR